MICRIVKKLVILKVIAAFKYTRAIYCPCILLNNEPQYK